MTLKLSTTVSNIERDVHNSENRKLLLEFYDFMKRIGTSERYQNNNLKALIAYSKFLDPSISFYQIKDKSQIFSFLDTQLKSLEEDPDKRWITTWNDYLVKIKYFFRWLYNCKDKILDDVPFSEKILYIMVNNS